MSEAKIAAGIGLCAALVWGFNAATGSPPPAVHPTCTKFVRRQIVERQDRFANLIGCDQAYNDEGRLIGWKLADTRCDRLATPPTGSVSSEARWRGRWPTTAAS